MVQDNAMAMWMAQHALWISVWTILASMAGAYGCARWVGENPTKRRGTALWAVAVGGAALFAVIAWSVVGEGSLTLFDSALAVALAGAVAPATLKALSLFTHFGERDILAVFAAAVLLFLLFRRQWALAIVWFAGTAGGGTLNRLLKLGFERARPEFTHGFVETHSYSFPSGHATGAMACYGMLAFLLIHHAPKRWHPWVAAGFVGLIAAVGLSRVLLHVHFASDVLAGWVITAAWIALCIEGYHVYREKALQV